MPQHPQGPVAAFFETVLLMIAVLLLLWLLGAWSTPERIAAAREAFEACTEVQAATDVAAPLPDPAWHGYAVNPQRRT